MNKDILENDNYSVDLNLNDLYEDVEELLYLVCVEDIIESV